jgi:tetratricopeptide (TPR) repeat protein
VNYRPEYQHSWGSKTYYIQLRLDPLPPAGAAEVLQALLGDDPSLAALKPLLIARTEGNPFFLEESVQTLVEMGVLVGEPGAYQLAQALPTIQVPATVQAVLAARMDRLPAEEKRLLQTASVIGTEVPLPLLQAIAEVPEAALRRGLAHLLALLREAESLAVTLDDPRRLGQVSRFLSNYFTVMGTHDQAIAAAQRALSLATADGDVVRHGFGNRYLGEAYKDQGDYRRAIVCFMQTVASLEGARRRERFGQVILPAVLAHAYLAECHAEVGTFAEGSALGEEGLRIAEAIDHPPSLMFAYWGAGLLSLRHGNLPRALPLLERAMALCRDADLPVLFPRVGAALGAAYALGGRVADAMPLLTQAVEQTTRMEAIGLQALCSLPLGEAEMLAGRLEEAHTLAEQVLALAREHQARGHEAYALRLLGEIAARREPPECDQAKAYYRQALALAEELGMRPLMAHCHLGLGKLYAKIGRRAEARAELSAAIELYRAMEMTLWLPQAEAALAQKE